MKNNNTIRALSPKPMRAGRLFWSTNTPMRLRKNPNGLAEIIASPPRAETGEPQPGRSSVIMPSEARAAKARVMPTRPTPARRFRAEPFCA
jgi:hypothetical protein